MGCRCSVLWKDSLLSTPDQKAGPLQESRDNRRELSKGKDVLLSKAKELTQSPSRFFKHDRQLMVLLLMSNWFVFPSSEITP